MEEGVTIYKGDRLVMKDGTHVAEIAVDKDKIIVMRKSGDIATFSKAELYRYAGDDESWKGPAEPLVLPLSLELVAEYLKVKPKLVADPWKAQDMTPRQRAGMLIRTFGTGHAREKCAAMPKGWGRRAVDELLQRAINEEN